MKKVLIAISFVSLIISCGPSAEQKAAIENEVIQRLKAKDDSIATVKRNEDAIKNAQKQHDDSIANSVAKGYEDKETAQRMNNQYSNLQKLLLECDGQLTILLDRKKHDEEFQIGRTRSERENTLKNDQINIDNLKIRMENIKNQIQTLKNQMASRQ